MLGTNITHVSQENGHRTSCCILKTECYVDLKAVFMGAEVTYELVPLHQHGRNAAEHAICKYANHILAGLSSCNPDFSLHKWNRLIL